MKLSIGPASAGLVLLAMGAAASAHPGPQIWMANDAGQITTWWSSDPTSSAPAPSTFRPQRVFVGGGVEGSPTPTGQLTEDPEVNPGSFSTFWPGFSFKPQGNIGTDTVLGFNFTAGLKRFDLASGAFVPVESVYGASAPQMAIASDEDLRVTNGQAQTGFNFLSAPDHQHLSFTFFGNGQSDVDGPDGVYLLSLEMTSTSLSTSLPFYILLGKEVPLSTVDYKIAIATAWGTVQSPAALPGDVNQDGRIDADDYAAIDRGAALHLSGWSNGDFNGDGVIDADDYLAMDYTYARLHAPLDPAWLGAREARFGSGFVTELTRAVPEPAIGVALWLPLGLRRRRRAVGHSTPPPAKV